MLKPKITIVSRYPLDWRMTYNEIAAMGINIKEDILMSEFTIKIISDGTREGTYIIDERGRRLKAKITSLYWSMYDKDPKCNIQIESIPAEIVSKDTAVIKNKKYVKLKGKELT